MSSGGEREREGFSFESASNFFSNFEFEAQEHLSCGHALVEESVRRPRRCSIEQCTSFGLSLRSQHMMLIGFNVM